LGEGIGVGASRIGGDKDEELQALISFEDLASHAARFARAGQGVNALPRERLREGSLESGGGVEDEVIGHGAVGSSEGIDVGGLGDRRPAVDDDHGLGFGPQMAQQGGSPGQPTVLARRTAADIQPPLGVGSVDDAQTGAEGRRAGA
jgi:hypothetical protein